MVKMDLRANRQFTGRHRGFIGGKMINAMDEGVFLEILLGVVSDLDYLGAEFAP